MRVFVDTSYFIARALTRDQWHEAAVAAVEPGMDFYTSSLVVNETITLLQTRGYGREAMTFLDYTIRAGALHVVFPTELDQREAWRLFRVWLGIGASAVDCSSFALMARLGIRRAFTFDEHFRAVGFQTLR